MSKIIKLFALTVIVSGSVYAIKGENRQLSDLAGIMPAVADTAIKLPASAPSAVGNGIIWCLGGNREDKK